MYPGSRYNVLSPVLDILQLLKNGIRVYRWDQVLEPLWVREQVTYDVCPMGPLAQLIIRISPRHFAKCWLPGPISDP